MGTDEAERFMEQEQESVRMIERLAVDAHIRGMGFLGRTLGDFTPDADGASINPIPRFAPGAVTEVGEELVETAHANPSLSPSLRVEMPKIPQATKI